MLQLAESGSIKKLNVEGGVAAKARAVYAGLFTPAPTAADDAAANGTSSPPRSPSPVANGSGGDAAAAANGSGSFSSSSSKLAPSLVGAVPLLKQLAADAPGQLAQLVALEWLLTVSIIGVCMCVLATVLVFVVRQCAMCVFGGGGGG